MGSPGTRLREAAEKGVATRGLLLRRVRSPRSRLLLGERARRVLVVMVERVAYRVSSRGPGLSAWQRAVAVDWEAQQIPRTTLVGPRRTGRA